MFKNALISTANKNGLLEFLKPLVSKGMRVVSTGGTAQYLRDAGIEVLEVATQTGFPEVMDGRVRTLHPSIHMPILARHDVNEDMQLLKEHGLEPFDLVVVNLYPFADALKQGLPQNELIEFIDIGGPSLLRAAAKNFSSVTVVCEPEDYKWLSERQMSTLDDRRKLAGRVFAHTARYDALIASTFAEDKMPEVLTSQYLVGILVQELRYGENPQQKAAWFQQSGATFGLHQAQFLQGKALSYNNILDLDAACGLVREFQEPCAVAVKHNNPCGVAMSDRIGEAVQKALHSDPVSVFGGIVALNREVDALAADELGRLFLECIIAPSFSEPALERLKKKKDLRLLKWQHIMEKTNEFGFRTVQGGYLLQTSDWVGAWQKNWTIQGHEPTERELNDMLMAWKVSGYLKSNAIAIVAGGQTVGLGMGQVNRVDAVAQAIGRMQTHHRGSQAVLASDAFFPFPDSIEMIAAAGIHWVIQPGGSIRDEAVLSRARELGVNMVLTQTRHFRH